MAIKTLSGNERFVLDVFFREVQFLMAIATQIRNRAAQEPGFLSSMGVVT